MKMPVGSFWWRDVLSQMDKFTRIATCKVNLGDTVCFWNDSWDLGDLKIMFPQVYSFVRDKKASVRKFLSQDIYANFFTPLSSKVVEQLTELFDLIQALEIQGDSKDQWSNVWGIAEYSSKKAYNQLIEHMHVSLVYKWFWKSYCRGRQKFTFLLLLKDRLNTRNILRRKRRILDDYSCPLCASQIEEMADHLFSGAPSVSGAGDS